jgi:diaminohydroxyphosphoribosylaminopyrimidine deaminase/5-amino-6-(5-phosphoribosylamino)uracil reductase
VGEGFHERKGEAHAETRALAAAGDRAAGATAVVTLEPCNHHGRTPPCRQALVDAGIARVVVALLDPTSWGDGGVAALRQAGVDVEVGVLAEEARLVLGPWLGALDHRRPPVTWACYLGNDGPVTVPEISAVGGPLRARFDAVLRDGAEVAEGAPGTHGAGAFEVSTIAPGPGVDPLLGTLYRGGVRSLLLDGRRRFVRPFLDAGVVDHVRVLFPALSGPSGVSGPDAWTLVPVGFRLERLERIGATVVVDAEPDSGSGLAAGVP